MDSGLGGREGKEPVFTERLLGAGIPLPAYSK